MIKKDKNSYRDDITGLRGIAVIGVIFFHLKLFELENGYLGVDIFFVISGYLICQIITKEINQKKFSIKNFYLRRIKRLIPMVFFIILISLPIFSIVMLPHLLEEYARSIISILFFFSNFFFFLNTDYFSSSAEFKPLLHFWSLSVEEQFYIFFPILIILIYKFFYTNIKVIFLFIFFFSLITTLSFNHSIFDILDNNTYKTYFSFYFPFSRVWEFLLGVIAALVKNNFKKYNFLIKNLFSIFGLFIVVLSLTLISKETKNPDIVNFIVTLGVFLILLFYDKRTYANKLLSNKILVFIGIISYSLYLWHFLFISFFKNYLIEENFFLNIKILILILSAIFSVITYKFIEQKFRFSYFLEKNLLKLSFFFISLILIFSGIIINKKGFIDHFYKNLDKNKSLAKEIYAAIDTSGVMIQKKCNYFFFDINNIDQNQILSCSVSNKKINIIIGDSHAQDLFNSFIQNDNKLNLVGINIPKDLYNIDNQNINLLKNFINLNKKRINAVLYHDSAEYYVQKKINEKLNLIEYICSFISECYYLGPRIRPNIDYINLLKRIKKKDNFDYYLSNRQEKEWQIESDYYLRNYQFKNLKYISLIKILKYNFKDDFIINNKLTFSDGTDHWSTFGEKYFGRKIIKNSNIIKKLF